MSNQQQMFDYAFDEARRMIEVAVCEASREETDQKAWWKRAMDLMSLSRDLASSIDEAEMFSEDGDTDTDDDDFVSLFNHAPVYRERTRSVLKKSL